VSFGAGSLLEFIGVRVREESGLVAAVFVSGSDDTCTSGLVVLVVAGLFSCAVVVPDEGEWFLHAMQTTAAMKMYFIIIQFL
jgi:hypothetical protein